MKKIYTKYKIAALGLPAVLAAVAIILIDSRDKFLLLNPKGIIAHQELQLMVIAVLLMLIVVVPVFGMTVVIAWKYRAGNKQAKYSPDWDRNLKISSLIWAAPALIILILAVVNWKSTHALDPYKPIAASVKPITIQVVALQWKWLFIYPEQNIATVNFVQFPVNTPVNFELTADAPMNSFWIPQLGGQMYAMAGMATHLHLMADAPGSFAGSAAEINGAGFAGMKFTAQSSSRADFEAWVKSIKQTQNVSKLNMDRKLKLNMDEYDKLVKPSENSPIAYYSAVESDLFNEVIMKYMAPASPAGGQMSEMEGIQ